MNIVEIVLRNRIGLQQNSPVGAGPWPHVRKEQHVAEQQFSEWPSFTLIMATPTAHIGGIQLNMIAFDKCIPHQSRIGVRVADADGGDEHLGGISDSEMIVEDRRLCRQDEDQIRKASHFSEVIRRVAKYIGQPFYVNWRKIENIEKSLI